MTDNSAPANPSFGLVTIDMLKSVPGLELLRGMMDGRFPMAPITKELGMRIVVVEKGRVVWESVPEYRFYNPLNSVHGGYLATLLDSAMACAVHSTLEAGNGYTTIEFKITFLRPVTDKTGPVRADGRIISVGKRVGAAEGSLLDGQGKVLAHATTSCLIFPL
jgi:uncharacterized protein (TIGR00369 family)